MAKIRKIIPCRSNKKGYTPVQQGTRVRYPKIGKSAGISYRTRSSYKTSR